MKGNIQKFFKMIKTRRFENPNMNFSLWLEYSFYKPSPERWILIIGFAVGTFNSLTGSEGDNGLIHNFGFTLESPVKY